MLLIGAKEMLMVKRQMTVSGNIVVAGIFLMLLIISSCRTHQNLVIHQSDTLSVVLRELPAGYPSIESFHHPRTIPSEEVFNILESLTHDAGALLPFSKAQPRRLFAKPQAEQLAPLLSKALSLAPPRQATAFTITEMEKPDRQTTGFAFVLNNEMHLIIETLRRPLYEGEQKAYQHSLSRWSLRTAGSQRLYARLAEGKGTMPNWIIIPLQQGP